jgi:hypothetical protein
MEIPMYGWPVWRVLWLWIQRTVTFGKEQKYATNAASLTEVTVLQSMLNLTVLYVTLKSIEFSIRVIWLKY